ncbi:Uncharacterized protein APZ42_003241, partial [Daphnia magna]
KPKPVDSRHGKIGLVHNTANGGAETRQRKIGSITEPVPQLGGSISVPVLYSALTLLWSWCLDHRNKITVAAL